MPKPSFPLTPSDAVCVSRRHIHVTDISFHQIPFLPIYHQTDFRTRKLSRYRRALQMTKEPVLQGDVTILNLYATNNTVSNTKGTNRPLRRKRCICCYGWRRQCHPCLRN